MIDISVNYMGLDLKSPFIAASSGYTADIEKMIALTRLGAGAIVLKSLFEEQINGEADFIQSQSAEHPENADFIYRYVEDYSIDKYATLIKEAKKRCGIPIIGSINCFSSGRWTTFAKEIERAGADALEINIYSLPLSMHRESGDIEREYFHVISEITSSIKIPVAVKMGDNFTNICKFVSSMQGHGAKGAVLFNRFYTPDISLKTLDIISANPFSNKNEYLKELRWIAIVSSMVKGLDLSASSGVYDPSSAIKLLLAGAVTVQLCSVLYKQGPFIVGDFVEYLKQFIRSKGFQRVEDFRGMLNYGTISNPQGFERVQFLKNAQRVTKEEWMHK